MSEIFEVFLFEFAIERTLEKSYYVAIKTKKDKSIVYYTFNVSLNRHMSSCRAAQKCIIIV